jgi:hypothetical protein
MMQHDEKYHTNQLNTTKIINIAPQYCKILQNTAKHLQITQNTTKYYKMSQNTYQYHKIPNIDPKLPQNTTN